MTEVEAGGLEVCLRLLDTALEAARREQDLFLQYVGTKWCGNWKA